MPKFGSNVSADDEDAQEARLQSRQVSKMEERRGEQVTNIDLRT